MIILILFSVVVFDQIKVGHDNPDNNTTTVTHEIIGNDSTGSVEVIRNMGNPDGQKRAYVVGVHPLENDTHKTFLKIFQTMKDLNCCYDVYIINVSEDFSQYGQLLPDDQPGRQTGQDLALKYVYPEIVNGSYKFVADIHAHGGAYGEHNTFVINCFVEGLCGFHGVLTGHEVKAMDEWFQTTPKISLIIILDIQQADRTLQFL